MTQIAKGISKEDFEAGISSESIQEKLKRLKWSLWHGNVFKALSKTENLIDDAYVLASDDYNQEPNIEAVKLKRYIWQKLQRELARFYIYSKDRN